MRLREDLNFVNPHQCLEVPDRWHLTTTINSGYNKLRLLESELHKEMANNPKTIRQRITDYMWDSYQRNKTVKFSSSMVIFALQQEHPSAKKQNIMQEISKAKKDGIIVSLKEPVPDQRGATYFTLSRILEEETEPSVTVPKVELPAQSEKPKVIPTNPFDKVHEKLNGITKAIENSEVNIDEEDIKKISETVLSSLGEQIHTLFGDIVNRINEVKQIASSHVTVDGDKLADVINARLKDANDEGSLFFAIHKSIVYEADRILEEVNIPEGVSNPNDYRAGIKDGIRMALEMGLKLDE